MTAATRPMNLLKVRAARALEMARLDGRPGLRRELLTMDYVLPLRLRRAGGEQQLSLRARSECADGTLYFGRDSFAVDRVAYFGIFLEGWYGADYRGAVVVDVGAHKGYYGAFALLEGAAEVHSYEPESRNFATIQRAAASFDKPWRVHNAAVGSAAGEATLHVNVESAGHSIVHEQTGGARPTLGHETVPVVAMTGVLEGAAQEGRPLLVKIDAEGAECDIVLGTPVDLWRRVDRVFLEIHDFAPCGTDDIVAHLAGAGLEVVMRERDDEAEADLVVVARDVGDAR